MAELPRILVVDDSRLVRMALVRNLKEHFEVREEGDGEAAWQTLILDPSIRAVISDLQMPKLDGYGLLERVRSSTQARLQGMPFIVVSGEETEEERERIRKMGVSDFVTKGPGSTEILTRLNNLFALAKARQDLEAGREAMVQDPASGLFSRKYLEHQAAQGFSQTTRSGLEMCIMVLGFDAFDRVCERLGPELAARVGDRFAKMLAGKIRQEDSLGHFAPGQYAIIAPGTSPLLFSTFAERVRQAVEAAHVPVQGQPVSLTVSIGLASVPVDAVPTALALLECAERRMRQAMDAGGKRIVSTDGGTTTLRQLKVQRALELLALRRDEVVRPHLGGLGIELLPLLYLMNQDLGLNLPMAEIERRLRDRAGENN
ncbi:MAG: diguanylate cyclase [Betaproteobacteria bacterium]